MRIGITGAGGFVGSAIVQGLKDQFDFQILGSKNLLEVDYTKAALAETKTLIHLAGISFVPDCEKDIAEAYKVNVGLACYLAEVFYRTNKGGHFIFASSGQVYDENEPVPHNENTKIAPVNLYARSKLCAEVALKEIAQHQAGRLTILRLYNHTHMSQSARFVLPSILQQIKASSSNIVSLKVGNIDVDRDFSAIQDLVSAFRAMLDHFAPGPGVEVYNLCSGVDKNLHKLISELARRVGKSVQFEIDPNRTRPNEPKRVVGDSSKFSERFHWTSRSQSIDEFLNLFMEKL